MKQMRFPLSFFEDGQDSSPCLDRARRPVQPRQLPKLLPALREGQRTGSSRSAPANVPARKKQHQQGLDLRLDLLSDLSVTHGSGLTRLPGMCRSRKSAPLVLFLLAALLAPTGVSAVPVISSPSVSPQAAWLGDTVTLSLACADGTWPVTSVQALITGPGLVVGPLDFSGLGPYTLPLDSTTLLYKPGNYGALATCTNSNAETANHSFLFSVSNLSSQIASAPAVAYLGETIEVDVSVKKDGVPLNASITFDVTVGGQAVSLLQVPPIYDTAKGFVLRFNASTLGVQTVAVTAKTGTAKAVSQVTVDIRKPADFTIVSVDPPLILSGQPVTLSLTATAKSAPVPITGNTLILFMDGQSIPVTVQGTTATFTAPFLSTGTHTLKASLTFPDGSVIDQSPAVTYGVQVTGKIANPDGSGLPATIRFVSNGSVILKTITTAADGSYGTSLPAGTYDIEITHPAARLALSGVAVTSFDNPLTFSILSNTAITGIRSNRIFVFDSSLPYQKAVLDLLYNEKDVLDETALAVYSCGNFNAAQGLCFSKSGWQREAAVVDVNKNFGRLETTTLGAFTVGAQRTLHVQATVPQESAAGGLIQISGVVADEDKQAVPNARLTFSGPGIERQLNATESGSFSLSFTAPDEEVTAIYRFDATLGSFLPDRKEFPVKVVRKPAMEVLAPELLRLGQGETVRQLFTVVNTGQAELQKVRLRLAGIPPDYYRFEITEIPVLKPGEQRDVEATFTIPADAEKTSFVAAFLAVASALNASQEFSVAIHAPDQPAPTKPAAEPTGRFLFPGLPLQDIAAYGAAVAVLGGAYLLRRRMGPKQERQDVASVLTGVKTEVLGAQRPLRKRRIHGIRVG